MTDEVIRVVETIAMLVLVIMGGLLARKSGLLDGRATSKLSGFVVDVAFPALVFTSMLRTVDAQILAAQWHLPVIGLFTILLGFGIGYLFIPLLTRHRENSHRGSIAFTIGTPNWLFIPLPIAIALYGDDGERAVLLFNMGALLIFWSMGIWMVKGGRPNSAALRKLATNPGLLATVMGIVIALLFPWTGTLEELDITDATPGPAIASIFVQAMAFLGEVTVPLSMIVTGSFLAGTGAGKAWKPHIMAISAIRLLVVPAGFILILWLAGMIGIRLPSYVRTIAVIIAAMPVAVTCSVVVEKYDRETALVSSAIFVSTLGSVATVPLIVWLVGLLGF